MKYLYAPGCAFMSYKPHLADKLKEIIESRYGQGHSYGDSKIPFIFLYCCPIKLEKVKNIWLDR